jgi:hypothetical protein
LVPAKAPDSAGIPSSVRAQGSDSLSFPLVRFDSPLRYVPKTLLSVSQLTTTLLGFFAPSTRETVRVHVLPFDRKAPLMTTRKLPPGSVSRSHPTDYGAAHRFSQPLSDLFLSMPSYHFQIGGVHGVAPFRDLTLSRSSSSSSPLVYPLDVLPAGCAAPVPG